MDSDDHMLQLARAIHGTPHATRASFSPSTWAGVERAWAWVVDNYYEAAYQQMKEPIVKQDDRVWQGPTSMTMDPPWTDEQREAARGIWMAHATGTLTFNAVLEAISHVAPLFVEQRAVPMAERALHTAHEFTPHGINLSATCGTQGQIDAIPWSDILRHAPKRAVPSIEACVEAFESLCYDHESKRDRRAGVESVRALCIGEQGDGASVPGDSGSQAGINNERGSGRPTSENHADRETSTPQAPKEPAPSPAPAGVAPWPTVQECRSEFAKGSGGIYPAFNTPGDYGIKAMHALFEQGRRTRDERIADLERELDP